jgi:hypothetical protein
MAEKILHVISEKQQEEAPKRALVASPGSWGRSLPGIPEDWQAWRSAHHAQAISLQTARSRAFSVPPANPLR